MRFSNMLLAIAAAALVASGNALSAATNAEQTTVANVASSDVVRSLESNDKPKRLLRSYKEDDGDDDEEEEEGSLDSVNEERELTFNKAKFNKMLQDSIVANKNYVSWFENGMNVKAVRDILRVENNKKYKPLVRAFKAFRKTQQGRVP